MITHLKNNSFFLLFVIILLTSASFYPGLKGFFIFDDYGSITNNSLLKLNIFNFNNFIEIINSGATGVLKRPISVISFAANVNFTGLNPFPFKLTNLIIHLSNGILVYFICKRLIPLISKRINPDYFSLTVCGLYLLHPLTLTSVLYIVQRMNGLAALFSLSGIFLYILGRESLSPIKSYLFIFSSIFICTPLAALSKENGLLLPYYIILIEYFFFSLLHNYHKFQKNILTILFFFIITVPILYIGYKTFTQPNWLISSYNNRDFSLSERLLTESRVLCLYLRLILVPDISLMGLFHDDIKLSTSFLSPISTLPAFAFIVILIASALMLRRKAPAYSFGILFFFVGHSMESTFIALELAHEHRNYFPMIGLIFIIAYYLNSALSTHFHNNRHFIIPIIFIFLAGTTAIRASQWGNQLLLPINEVKNHPTSFRANRELAKVYSFIYQNDPQKNKKYGLLAIKYASSALAIKPYSSDSLLYLIKTTYFSNQSISDNLYASLFNLLKTQPITGSVSRSIDSFVECFIVNKCHPTLDQLNTIFLITINNPTTTRAIKAAILINVAKIHVKQNNIDNAIKHLYKATQEHDIFENRFLLAKTLIEFNFYEDAEKQIKSMQKTSYSQWQLKKIENLENMVQVINTPY